MPQTSSPFCKFDFGALLGHSQERFLDQIFGILRILDPESGQFTKHHADVSELFGRPLA